MNKLQLVVEDGRRVSDEWKVKYESVKAEGKGVRQQVLEAVGYVVDIINITRERLQALVRACASSCSCSASYSSHIHSDPPPQPFSDPPTYILSYIPLTHPVTPSDIPSFTPLTYPLSPL